jgi:hypothetical protein
MKRLVLIALIISAAAGIVFAQVDIPTIYNSPDYKSNSPWASPQSVATSGRIRSTADNFIRADAYVDVKFDKFFAMTSYRNAPGTAHLGYAGKAGGLYVGAYYGGSFWANVPNVTYTEGTISWLDTASKSGVKNYDSLPGLGANAPSNTLSLLFGVADMGFRLSVYTNKKLFSDSDFAVDIGGGAYDYYKSYETESGVVTPQLLWSMTKNLTDNGIKPYFGLDLAFTKNYTKESKYDNSGGSWTAIEKINNSDINTVAKISAGLGGYTLLNKDGFRFSADLDYVLNLTSYDNEYNYIDSNGNYQVKTGFKGTYDANTNAFVESSATYHTITPSVSGQWGGGPISLRFKLNLGVPISETINTGMAYNKDGSGVVTTDGSLVKNGRDSKAVMVGFNPDLRLAAQWKIVPKLALNLGGRINFNTINSTTTEGKYYNNGTDVDNTSFKTVATSNPTSITNSLATGVTFNVTDNVTFEAASGATNGTVNVFGTSGTDNGLFYFTTLLVSLRY